MTVTLEFRCGHREKVDPDKTPSPQCLQCGETRIARTIGVRAPRFVGLVRGPLAQTTRLQAIPVDVARTPLPLKET